MLGILFQTIFGLVVMFFLAYAVLELRLVVLSRRSEKVRMLALDADDQCTMGAAAEWPKVTVLLPVYNESRVIKALIDVVCALAYPADKLQILVLDDSTDETTALASSRVARYAEQGVDIAVIKRKGRKGYKAGNLAHGLQFATGEFLALFDADFVPPRDFLYQTIPCFSDSEIGYLQTGIDYANRNTSFLTRFQAMMMGQQQFVTTGLGFEGLMASLSGSSCVWRRRCLESLGGWTSTTLTEDVEIGYKAQFLRWRYAYLRHVVSLSELPESIDAIRVQRHRWAHGLIHNAFKHLKQFFRTRLTLVERLHALSLMFSSVLLALIYILVLLSLPLAVMGEQLGVFFDLVAWVFLSGAVLWVAANFVGFSQNSGESSQESAISRLIMMVAYVSMFFPLSLYYFVAGVQLLFKREYEFKRTPKAGERERDSLNRVFYMLEWATFLYSLLALVLAVQCHNFWMIPFNGLVCLGFGIVLYYATLQKWEHAAA